MSLEGKVFQPADYTLLVVDDDPLNRELLRDAATVEGYAVQEAPDGAEALELISDAKPDVVLLDILMPGMNGLDVCRRIKSDERTRHIPVILITAQRGRQERLEGIAAGATDFLNKPVDISELRLRLRNAIRTKQLYDEVRSKWEQVAALEKLRDDLVHMIVHDLRSPLFCVLANLEEVQQNAGETLPEETSDSLTWALGAATTMNRMIDAMLDLSRLESGEMPLSLQTVDLNTLVAQSLVSTCTGVQRAQVMLEATDEDLPVSCDPDLMQRVVLNLLGNALDFSPTGEPVIVRTDRLNGHARVSVTDRGPGIPAEFRVKIFEKFGQIDGRRKGRKVSTGLGLAFCKLAVEAHGGVIGVKSQPGAGSIFWLELPCDLR